MKKILSLMALLAMAFVSTHCSESDPDEEKTILIPSNELTASIDPEAVNHTIHFETTQSWTASVKQTRAENWISIYPTSGEAGTNEIEVTLAENTDSEEREAVITIVSGSDKVTVTVTQRGSDATEEPEEPEDPGDQEIAPEDLLTYIEITETDSEGYQYKNYATLTYDDKNRLTKFEYYSYDSDIQDKIRSSYTTEVVWGSDKVTLSDRDFDLNGSVADGDLIYPSKVSNWEMDYLLNGDGLFSGYTDPDGDNRTYSYNADGTLASITNVNPGYPEANYQSTLTWEEGNLTNIVTSGNDKDRESETFTYTDYSNSWNGIDIGASLITDITETDMIIGMTGIHVKNLPARRENNYGDATTYTYTFDGNGRVSTIVASESDGSYTCEYKLHYGAQTVPTPEYLTHLTEQTIVDEGTLPYTFEEENPDVHHTSNNAYTSYVKVRSKMSDGSTKEQTFYEQIVIWPSDEGALPPFLTVSQEDIDSFGIVSTSFQEVDLGENVINPHRFVYTLVYNCFEVNLVCDVNYPYCQVFNADTYTFEEHQMPILPIKKENFLLKEPSIQKSHDEENGDGSSLTWYNFTHEYLFKINEEAPVADSDYQSISCSLIVEHPAE